MSTAIATSPAAVPSRDSRPSLARLIRVELRKMHDTRAGFWLLLSSVLLAALIAAAVIFSGGAHQHNLADALEGATQVMNILLPIVGILLVTSEWSQRTAQVTFTLVPQRERVLVAKIGAAVVVALAAFVITLAIAALFTALGGEDYRGEGPWSMDGVLIPQIALYYLLSMLIGLALGAAILLSAPAIVASFALPLGVSIVLELTGADNVAAWVGQGETLSPLAGHALSGHEWARLLVGMLLWLALPMAIGLYRFLRNEVR